MTIPSEQDRQSQFFNCFVWVFLGLAVLVAIGVRVRLLDFPLERDEGEYAYAGQLILQGIPPYHLVYNMKMPGIYLAYAGIMLVFGQTVVGIHLGLILVHLSTLVVLFRLARTWLDLPGAATTTATYALMTLSSAFLGLAAHATHFVVLPALLGFWLLAREGKNLHWWTALAAGCLFGLAFLMKQQGMFLGIFGGIFLMWGNWAGKGAWARFVRITALYSLGCLLPFLAVCLWLKTAGVFPEFWFWTISYARQYVGVVPLHTGIGFAKSALSGIFWAAPMLWLLAGWGGVCLCLTRLREGGRFFLGGLLVFSFLAVCPGFYFRNHYFIVLVPAVALLAGLAVSWGDQRLATMQLSPALRQLPFLIAVIACAQSVYADRAVYFSLSPATACRAVYGINPFPESPTIARYVEEHTQPDDRITVIGSEPQIFFLAHRHSSTGHIYSLPLLQPQPFARTMQQTMIDEIEQNTPAYLILVSTATSWEATPESSHLVADWLAGYLPANLEQVGMIQYLGTNAPESDWGREAVTVPVRSDNFVAVFKRLNAASPDVRAEAIARDKILMDRFNNCALNAAIDRNEDALRLNPNDGEAHNNLGVALNAKGDAEAAVTQFQDALRLDPEDGDAHNNLGVLLNKMGQSDAAISQFQEAVRLKPGDAASHYNLANALLKAGRNPDALKQFREAIRLKPEYAPAHYNLGVTLNKSGEPEAAIKEFREAIRLQPDYAIAHNSLGVALAGQGQIDEAIREFKEALKIKTDYASAQNNLTRAMALKAK